MAFPDGSTTNPCGEIALGSNEKKKKAVEPILAVDSDGVVHRWFPNEQIHGWSSCGLERNDVASFAYEVPGGITCIGCLACEGDSEEIGGLLNSLTRSMEMMKKRGVKLSPMQAGTLVHAEIEALHARIPAALGVPREYLGLEDEDE